jgi:hypothetical protein
MGRDAADEQAAVILLAARQVLFVKMGYFLGRHFW